MAAPPPAAEQSHEQQQPQQHPTPASPGGHDDDDSSLSDSSEDNEHHQQPPYDPNDPNQPPPLPSHPTDPSLPYVPSGHNKTKGGYRKVIRKDKQKHNESESRRRSRLRGQFMELRTAAKCSKKDRFSILNHALDRFAYLEERIGQLEKGRGIRSVVGAGAVGGGGGGGAGEGGEGDGGSAKADGSAVVMEGGMASGGSVVGGINSSFSIPTSIHRTTSAAAGSTPAKSLDTSSSNGSYTSSFHSYDPNASSSNNNNNNNANNNNNNSASTPNSTNMKLLSDPLTNYPILACLPTCFIALDGKFKDTNTAFCHLLGYSRDSLLQTTLFTVTHPNELMSTFAQLKRLLGGEVDCWEGPKLLVRGDGSVLSVHMTITCAKKYGKPDLYVGFFVPKSNSEPAAVPSPQPQPHMQPTGMQSMYGAAAPMRGPMPSHTVGTLPRTAHSPFSPLTSFPPGYGDPSLTSPHGRPLGGNSFMPPGQAATLTAAGGGMSGQAQPMFGASGQQT